MVSIALCVGFGFLAGIEFDDRGRWTKEPFTTLTQVVISTGSASGLLSLLVTEIGRTIVLFSVWLEKKLNENLEKSREHTREKARNEVRNEERSKAREEGRSEGIEYGRTVGLLESQGKQPPPPPWGKNGDEQSN